MSTINGKEVDTNASHSAYGWVFQVGAGITLMLDNVKEFSFLKMEGKNDDIELTIPSGKIYAQAKSVTQMGNQKSASQDLKAALKLLESDNRNSDAVKLVYITNIVNPLSSRLKTAFQYEHVYDFSTLSNVDQNKIKAKVSDDFPIEKFKIHILNFFGEGDNKFANVKSKIETFLREAIGDASYSKQVLDSWFETFMVNCSDKPKDELKCELSKEEIMVPVILVVIDSPIDESEFNEVGEYDDYEELLQAYRGIIKRLFSDYSFSTRVLGDFLEKQKMVANKKNYRYEYVKKEWSQYEYEFMTIRDEEEREALIKLILLTIITKRKKISRIKGAANL